MAEFSMWWTTGGAGDGAATYTRNDHAMWSKVLASCNGMEGVAPNYLNKLVGAAGGANTVNIGTGGALVDGKVYNNSAVVAVNIPSAVGGGNTRIDRIVLRANWTAQTVRITRIAGTDAAAPVAPAITQSSGTTYDIMLCQVLVDTAGNVTVTDERTLAQVKTADLADGNVKLEKIEDFTALTVLGNTYNYVSRPHIIIAGGDGQVLRRAADRLSFGQIATAGLADGVVTNPKLRDSAALSVIGRAANSVGDPADIAAAADGDVLRRAGTVLGFGQIATAGLADGVVTNPKLRDSLALSVIGRAANTLGDPADIAAAADGDVLRRAGTVLGFGQITTAGIGDSQVTAAKIANRTRSFFVMADGVDKISLGVLLDAAVQTVGFGRFIVPSDYVSGMTITSVGFTYSAGGGNSRQTLYAYHASIGEAYNTHNPTTGEATVAVAQDDWTSMQVLSLPSAVVGDIVVCVTSRDGADALDTVGDIYLPGFIVSYTADS